jgi:Flp pilus assembly protein TadG
MTLRSCLSRLLARLRRDIRGMAMIETAAVAPVLALLGIGAFQVSAMVARQGELQGAAAEAEGIVLAKQPTTQAQLDTIKNILVASTGLTAGEISVSYQFRCGTAATRTTSQLNCGTGVRAW